jgi:predicted nucleic acid-binding Zn ribbon protein
MSPPSRDPRKRLSRPKLPGEMGEPVSIGDAAALVGAELGLAAPLVFTRIVDAWPDLVGEMVAAHSRVRGVRNGVLEVAVDSPGWATEFRYLEGDLVERASRLVGPGVVTAIRAVVDGPPGDASQPRGTGRRQP